jgi:hypothetical protein
VRAEHFALTPVPPRRLAVGLLGAAFAGIATAVTLLAFISLVIFGARLGVLPAVRAKFPVQVPQVGLDRVRRQVELGSDLRRTHVGWQVPHHAGLALGERLAGPGRFAGWWRGPARLAE